VRSPAVLSGKIKLVRLAVALLLLPATTHAVLGAETKDCLPGSGMGLNQAIVRSDVIASAILASREPGTSSAKHESADVRIKLSAGLKGDVHDLNSTAFSCTVLDGEAAPQTGEEYIFFIKNGGIIKVLRATKSDVRAVTTMLKNLDVMLNGKNGRMHGDKIGLDEAARRSDIVEIAKIVSQSFIYGNARKCIPENRLKPSAALKGELDGQEQTFGLSVLHEEALPRTGQEYIFFIDTKTRNIIKVLHNTQENRRDVEAVVSDR
jgi:hypothetical protein